MVGVPRARHGMPSRRARVSKLHPRAWCALRTDNPSPLRRSPVYGMPIRNVDQARHVIDLKRGMSPGFASIDNALFFKDNARMLLGDARRSVTSLVTEVKTSKGRLPPPR